MAVYFIIGGSTGIGQQLAQQLVGEGHRVYATYRQTERQGTDLLSYHPLDVEAETPDIGFLPDAVDGFVYCPGSIQLKPFNRLQPADFTADFQLNVVGLVKTLQAVLPRLRKAESASVVLFSTVAVQLGLPFHALVSASKGAIEGLARALAAELAPRIRVNCIAPSLTDTPLASALLNTDEKKEAGAQRHPLKRIGRVDDIAGMAAFLLSGKAGWISGQVLAVDGGMSRIRL